MTARLKDLTREPRILQDTQTANEVNHQILRSPGQAKMPHISVSSEAIATTQRKEEVKVQKAYKPQRKKVQDRDWDKRSSVSSKDWQVGSLRPSSASTDTTCSPMRT